MAAPDVQETIDTVAGNYESLLRELRKVDAKGVVIAINGRIVWADLFPATICCRGTGRSWRAPMPPSR